MINLKIKQETIVETKTNPISQMLIDKYGEVSNWPKACIKNRQIKCRGCMQEFTSDDTKDNIFEAGHEARVVFICPNCGEHNAIKRNRLDT